MQRQLHIVDEQETDRVRDDVDLEIEVDADDVSVDAPVREQSIYEQATEPPWKDYNRQTAAFIKSLLPAVGKEEFLDDRRRVHHYKQLEELRLVDELDTSTTDDADLALLFALPDESLLFVGSDPTAKETTPLYGFLVDTFAPIPAPASAQEALDLLRPDQVRSAFESGDEPDRQGEWWLLPTKKVPVEETFEPGVSSRPFGPSPLANHVPREWGMTVSPGDFMDDVRDRVDQLPGTIETAPELIEWVHRQHQRVPTPESVPEWSEIQDLAGEILVRGTLRHRENDHFVESLGETWHVAETHNMEVYTADEFDRVVLD
ncbi:hypothetical protein [Natrinema sp. CGMCC1.2065]|uniref:hypothetical protein n=1 Tax=Natrinema sp. CGMCC1.2065 TaxID=3445767 RepID=UPI003F4A7229